MTSPGSAVAVPSVAEMRRRARRGAQGSPFLPWEAGRLFAAYNNGAVFDTPWQVRDLETMLEQDGAAAKAERLLRQAVKSAPWEVREAPGDRGEARFVREQMGRMIGPLIKRCTMGFSRRKTFHELVWDTSDGVQLADVALRPIGSCVQEWTRDGRPDGFRQYVPFDHPATDPTRPGTAKIDALGSFVYIHGRDTEPMRGTSDLAVTQNIWAKKNKLLFLLLQFLEQQTSPRIGAYGDTDEDAGANADMIAETLGGGVFPVTRSNNGDPGAKLVEIIESSGKGASEFLTTLRWFEEQQDNSLLMGFMGMTSQAAGTRGSYGMVSDLRELFQASQQEEADELAEQIAEGPVAKATVLAFGADAKLPSLHIGPISKDAANVALEMLNSVTTATTVNIPDGVVDLLWTQCANKLGLDVDQVREAVEEWRDGAKADAAGQPGGSGDPEQDADGIQLAHTVDLTYGLVTDALAGVDPQDALARRLELARKVRTPEGSKRYGVPIGSPIPEGRRGGKVKRAASKATEAASSRGGSSSSSSSGRSGGSGKVGEGVRSSDGRQSGTSKRSTAETSASRGTSLADAKAAAASSGESRYVTRGADNSVTVSTTPPKGAHYRVSPAGSLIRVDEDGRARPVPPAALPAIERSLAGAGKRSTRPEKPATRPDTPSSKPDAPAAKTTGPNAHDGAIGRAAFAAEQPDVKDDGSVGSQLSLALQRAGRTGKEQFISRDANGDSKVTDVEPDGTHIRVTRFGQVYNVKDGDTRPVADTAVDKYTTPTLGKYKPDAADGPTPDGRTTNPAGKAVADRIDTTGLTGASRKEAHIALDAIAKVHSDGDTRNDVNATSKADPFHRGTFTANAGTHDSPAESDVDNINVKETGSTKALTFTHEVGHYLDRRGLGDDTLEFSSRGTDNGATSGSEAEAMQGFLDAARGSDALRLIGERADSVGTPGYRDYLESPHEMWARAYAQFIATRSQDRTMMRQLRLEQEKARNSTSQPPTQWSDEDFAPIDTAIEKVLRAKGWMK